MLFRTRRNRKGERRKESEWLGEFRSSVDLRRSGVGEEVGGEAKEGLKAWLVGRWVIGGNKCFKEK